MFYEFLGVCGVGIFLEEWGELLVFFDEVVVLVGKSLVVFLKLGEGWVFVFRGWG
jgi:hypothetical protein